MISDKLLTFNPLRLESKLHSFDTVFMDDIFMTNTATLHDILATPTVRALSTNYEREQHQSIGFE